jgi:hypothetical protein
VLFKEQAEARKLAVQSTQVDDAEPVVEAESSKKRSEIPHILPPELLESDDDDHETTEASRPSKKVKFSGAQELPEKRLPRERIRPRDKRVGSTVYRVLSNKEDLKLAPKAGKHSVNLKTQLLVRRRLPRTKSNFFLKRR